MGKRFNFLEAKKRKIGQSKEKGLTSGHSEKLCADEDIRTKIETQGGETACEREVFSLLAWDLCTDPNERAMFFERKNVQKRVQGPSVERKRRERFCC